MLPNVIIGDMDSIRPETLEHFKANDVQIVKDSNQDNTDFRKAGDFLLARDPKPKRIFFLSAFGGRIDHTLSNMSNLYQLQKEHDTEIILLDRYSKMICLRPDIDYEIQLSKAIDLKEGVGIVPVPVEPSKNGNEISTTGFKWNIQPGTEVDSLSWDTLLSTSNEIENAEYKVTIKSKVPLFVSTTLVYSNDDDD